MKKYRSILFYLLSTLIKYAAIGGVITLAIFGFIERKRFTASFEDFVASVLAYFIIGCAFGVIVFLLTGLKSETFENLGGHFGLLGIGLLSGEMFSGGGIIILLLSFILRLLVAVFYAIAFLPLTLIYCLIMAIIEIFADIPESIGNITDHLPQILSILFVITMLLKVIASI